MAELVLLQENGIRLGAFLTVFVAMAGLEALAPRRHGGGLRLLRWSNNAALVVLDTALLRLLFPILAVGAALIAAERGWGLLNLVQGPEWLALVIAVLALDLIVYAQHLLFHHVPWLWRLHRVHHADPDLDVTTALRFHPLEIMLSMLIKLAAVIVLGAPAVAVVVFEVLLNAAALFNHANVRLPSRLDGILRLVIVTPDMHRVHHSIRPQETNSNYGFNLSVWDRVFGSYRAQPQDGHETMTIGLARFRTRRDQWLDRLLAQPFLGPAADGRGSPPSGADQSGTSPGRPEPARPNPN